ncbi:hypothetical protein B0H14DRAFT_2965821 [Mycena olivaceomarginata]|nr:hypothetical protein B0H14DRAFT_2965821 [Mycena olivaceomarginata]
MFLISTLTVWLYVFHAVCQGQQASSLWRKPNVTMSLADRVSVAQAALEKAITSLDTTTALFPDAMDGKSGALYSQMAEFDLATNQTKYADTLQQNYGHGAAVAYATYKTEVFLQYAEQVWWTAKAFTLEQNDLNKGTVPFKDFTISSSCGGITTAGATFREKSSTIGDINVLATGLSGLLAETTGKDLYLAAATESADFIHNHLLNAQNIVQDGISVQANDSCAINEEALNGDQQSCNSGLMIDGLVILYSITQNASIFDTIQQMVPAAIEYAGWQGSNGIVGNGPSKSGDIFLPRALSNVISRNATTPALRSYIEAYLGVQFNAVVDLATTSGSNVYAGSWSGPPSSTFSSTDQTNAIQALMSVINLQNETSSTTPSDAGPSGSSNYSPTPSPRKTSRVGPIVGGTLGGLLLLACVVLGVVLLRRRTHRRRSAFRTVEATPAINPFNGDPPKMAVPPRESLRNNDEVMSVSRLPTDELVAILYRRMQNVESGDGDRPPDYPASETGH